ncbi:MAG: bifunctional glutamate N-acetyltransferase/amino-acid acetyltransferase ArgJ [Actinomycetota bacterium]|nr:bifunctional glutamate N-acetyltransferase/amino-acid acetyltransferase ArgJ [Actinomycetota bacterium]
MPHKGVTAPKGFEAAGIACGIKASRKKDLALVYSQAPAVAVAAFTDNRVVAAPVTVSKQNLKGEARAIVINSGNANACTGPKGLLDAKAMVRMTAVRLGVESGQVLVASTGIIGRPMPMDKIEAGMELLDLSDGPEADIAFARAIMTTDAFPKQLAVEIELSGGTVSIGGVAKGGGMIAPSLAPHATMIAVVTTDAPVKKHELHGHMTAALSKSFNAVTVDGDTSTNDTIFVLANGMAGEFKLSTADKRVFQEALDYVCVQLAKMIVRDGEGATKLIEYKVVGAKKDADAVKVAKTVANSILVKTAFFGQDPNWGRILAAAGRAGVALDPDDLDVDINGVPVVRSGQAADLDVSRAADAMKAEEIQVWINLNQGSCQAVFYGSDLSYDYVKINAEYTT